MKIKRKIFVPIIIVVILLICLVPVRTRRNVNGEFVSYLEGGGTYVYSAIFYKVIVWDEMYLEHIFNSSFKQRKGVDVYIFPFNFGDKSWRGE